MKNRNVSINPSVVTNGLALAALFLIVASSAAVTFDYAVTHDSDLARKLMKLFYVELELNIPAFFSMLMMLFASALLGGIYYLKLLRSDTDRRPWAVLALGYLLMSFDEIIAVHERLIEPMRVFLGETDLGVLYFGWVLPASVLVAVLGIYFFRFFWALKPSTRLRFIVAAILFLGGTLGFELLEGRHVEAFGKGNVTYVILTTMEEALEMAGVITFIRALLLYLGENFPAISLAVKDRAARNLAEDDRVQAGQPLSLSPGPAIIRRRKRPPIVGASQ